MKTDIRKRDENDQKDEKPRLDTLDTAPASFVGPAPVKPPPEALPEQENPLSSVEARLKDMPPKYRGLYKRAMGGKSKSAAIRAFCLECMGWVGSEVRRCTAPACPLYPYRPGGSVERGEPE